MRKCTCTCGCAQMTTSGLGDVADPTVNDPLCDDCWDMKGLEGCNGLTPREETELRKAVAQMESGEVTYEPLGVTESGYTITAAPELAAWLSSPEGAKVLGEFGEHINEQTRGP